MFSKLGYFILVKHADLYFEITRFFPSFCLQLYYQVLNFGMIVSSALMIWKGLMVVTGSESPIVVVLRWVRCFCCYFKSCPFLISADNLCLCKLEEIPLCSKEPCSIWWWLDFLADKKTMIFSKDIKLYTLEVGNVMIFEVHIRRVVHILQKAHFFFTF